MGFEIWCIEVGWKIVEKKNTAIEAARKTEKAYWPELLANGYKNRPLLA